MRVVVVTGTSTGIGKTLTTAAFAAVAVRSGIGVGVVKPVQTGVEDGTPSDAEVVSRLGGCPAVDLVRLADPLAPDTAARLRGVEIPSVAALAAGTEEALSGRRLGLVEGAGGVAVRLDTAGGTIATLAQRLREAGHDVQVVVVTTLTLGTLSATELVVQALVARGLPPAGLVYGDLSPDPDLAERCNLGELPRVTGLPVLAALPRGVGAEPPEWFRRAAEEWLTPAGRVLIVGGLAASPAPAGGGQR